MKEKFKLCIAALTVLLFLGNIFDVSGQGMANVYAMEPEIKIVAGVEAAVQIEEEEEVVTEIQMLYVNTAAYLYKDKDENSQTLLELDDTSIVILVEDEGEWCKVTVGGITGYMKAACLQEENPDPEFRKEMEELAEYNEAFVNELTRLQNEKQRSRIFGAIIIVLIVAIFGVGIGSVLWKKRKLEQGEEGKAQEEEAER